MGLPSSPAGADLQKNITAIKFHFMHIAKHLRWFKAYAKNKISNASIDQTPLALKRLHTMHVYANACRIAAQENLAPDLARICKLAALYHDLARFDQYLEFATFKDACSRNHGLWAVKLLKQTRRLEDEPISARHAILTAVGMHNRRELPKTLTGNSRLAAKVVRDADKLDILRVMDEHLSAPKPYNPTVVLSLPDDDNLCSSKVIVAALNRKSASYSDLRSVNDFRLLLGTWLFDMNFPSSARMFIAKGHAHRLVSALPENGAYGKAKAFMLGCFNASRASSAR